MASAQKNAQAIRPKLSQLTTANDNLDGTGSLVAVAVGTTGKMTLVTSIHAAAIAATTLGALRFFIFDGTNTRYLGGATDWIIYPLTPSSPTVPAWSRMGMPFGYQNGIMLLATWELRMATKVTETFNIITDSVDYDV